VGLLLAGSLILIWIFRAELLIWSETFKEPYRKLVGAFLSKAFTPDPIYQQRLLLRWTLGLNTPVFLLLANLIMAGVGLSLWSTRRITSQSAASLILLVVSLDLLLAGGTTINPVRAEERWQQLSGGAQYVLDHVGPARVLPLGVSSEDDSVHNLGQYFPSVYRVYSASGYSSPLKLARYETLLNEADPVQAIQLLGVRYILTRGQMGADVAATYPLVYSDADSFVYENKNPLPRTFVVHQAVEANDPVEALAHFQQRKLDPRQTVVLESAIPISRLAAADRAATPSSAEIVEENPQSIRIEARLASDGYLVLLDTFYPGWTATIDGQPTAIYRADYIGRAIFVPAGEHRVRFEYWPWSFWLGLWLAVGVVIVLAGTAFFSYRPLPFLSSINHPVVER
jgi:hypothetical protein